MNQARAEFPTRGRLLGAYRKEVSRLRAFVGEHDLVTLPEQDCEVVETPPFDRALNSFAAYIAPGPFEEDQRGQFWVTPIDTTAPRAQQLEQLEAHCNYLYPVTAADEAYPGHHVHVRLRTRSARAGANTFRRPFLPKGGRCIAKS